MPQSVQCPRCQSSVAVADDAGGARVTCPKCEEEFVVPGIAASTVSDDDDWLQLDDQAPPSTQAATTTPAEPAAPAGNPAAASSSDATPSDTEDEWFGLDLPPVAPIPVPGASLPDPGDAPTTPAPSQSPTGAVAKPAAASSQPAAPGPDPMAEPLAEKEPVATNVEYKSEFTIRCPMCGSPSDVKASQSGEKVRCQDCHMMIKVPPAPRKKTKVHIDMEAAPVFQFSPSQQATDGRPADPFRKSADEYLADAERIDKEEPKPDLETPKIRDWAKAVFGIFIQVGVMAHWIILSTVAGGIAFIVVASDHPVLMMALFPGGLFFGAMVLACAFTILQSVANEEETVTDWPLTLEPMEWLAPMMFCFAAVGLAIGPGWFLGHMTFGESLTTVFMVMASVFLVFPFVLLSMLDMQNMFVPFSPEVGRSVTQCEEAWGGFYFSSALLFFLTFLTFTIASLIAPPAAAVICVFAGVGATFVYFSMLGRLAYAIGHSVNSKPRENDIDQRRAMERDNGT